MVGTRKVHIQFYEAAEKGALKVAHAENKVKHDQV